MTAGGLGVTARVRARGREEEMDGGKREKKNMFESMWNLGKEDQGEGHKSKYVKTEN